MNFLFIFLTLSSLIYLKRAIVPEQNWFDLIGDVLFAFCWGLDCSSFYFLPNKYLLTGTSIIEK